MPIQCPLSFKPVADSEFAVTDRTVMGCCFASQNFFGRLCDEQVYENDVAVRLNAEGLARVHTQVPLTVSHESFSKTYRLDLIVNGIIYELKAASAFAPEHEAQAIHYAALTAADRVKLINFRAPRVEGLLLRSPLWRVNRREFTLDKGRWKPISEACEGALARLIDLLQDWGAFLETSLYEEALVHFAGGEARCQVRLPVVRGGLKLGTQRMVCHDPAVGLVITGVTTEIKAHESHLRRLLSCLPLRALHWFNLNHAELQAVTLVNGKGMEARE